MAAPSAERAARKARLRKRKRRGRGRKDLPHAGVILEKRKLRRLKRGAFVQTDFVAAADWSFSLDAGLLVDAASTALLAWYHDTIVSGVDPTGTRPKKPLTTRVAKRSGRKSKNRGHFTGFLATNLRRTKITGSTVSARTRLLPPTRRNVFIAQEQKRGIHYLLLGGKADETIKLVTGEFVEGGIVNENRATERRETTSGRVV